MHLTAIVYQTLLLVDCAITLANCLKQANKHVHSICYIYVIYYIYDILYIYDIYICKNCIDQVLTLWLSGLESFDNFKHPYPSTLFFYFQEGTSRTQFWIMKYKNGENEILKIKWESLFCNSGSLSLWLLLTCLFLTFHLMSPSIGCWVFCVLRFQKKNLCDGWKSMQWSMLSDLSYLSPNTDTHLGQVFGSESCLCFWQNVSVICHHLIFMPHQIVTACRGSEPLGRQQSSLILSNDSLEQPLSFTPQVQVRSLLNVNI